MEISLQTTLDGKAVTVLNGKSYGLTVFFESKQLDGPFAFMFGGVTPLKMTDLAQGWKVISATQAKSGLAIAQRAFAYYTIVGGDPPEGWPRFKNPPDCYAFIGPTAQAIHTQIKLVVAQYRPDLEDSVDQLIKSAARVEDRCGTWPDALLIEASELRTEQT